MDDKIDFYKGEVPANFERKCPLVLVLDISSSMEGEAIREMNEGLKVFQQQILKDVTALARLETMIVTFSDTIVTQTDFSLLDKFQMPLLVASGSTKMVDAVRTAMICVEARKAWYKSQGLTYYRPYIILMTDGVPDDDQDVAGLALEIRSGVDAGKFRFWAFGVTGADESVLKKISHPEFPPQKLKGYGFVNFFKWLSKSMTAVSKSKPDDKLNLAPKTEEENPFQIKV